MKKSHYIIWVALAIMVTDINASESHHTAKSTSTSCKVSIHKKDSQKTVIRKLRTQMDCLEHKIGASKAEPKVEHVQSSTNNMVSEVVGEVQPPPPPKKLQIRYPSALDEEICLTSPNNENCYNGLIRE